MDNENILLTKSIEELQEDIQVLKAELTEREAALPAHSVRPHQLITIEELEEEISMKEEILNAMEKEGREG